MREARGALRVELEVGDDTALVEIVARLVPIKAQEVFLVAAAALHPRVPESRFVLVGDDKRRGELAARVRQLGLADRIHFLGWRGDLDRVYADLDLVALTSKNEGSPVSLIEAMAAARPVVASRVGGVPDLLGGGVTGCLVPSGDAGALAAATVSLIRDHERQHAMGAAGRKRVAPAFRADRLVEDMNRLYAGLRREKAVAGASDTA